VSELSDYKWPGGMSDAEWAERELKPPARPKGHPVVGLHGR